MSTKKPETLLALDIGNTHVVLGIFIDGELKIRRKLSTLNSRTPDEAGVLVKMLCQEGGVDTRDLTDVAIASVSPSTGRVFKEMTLHYLGLKPLSIHGEIPGFTNEYRNPRNVGADRVCDSISAFDKYGGPVLIVDFGTAITIDVVDEDGAYKGGVIMPGLETSSATLKKATALLPEARLIMPKRHIGTTTDESIRIGIMMGAIYSLRGLIASIRDQLDAPDAKVIATGGMAKYVAPYMDEVHAIEPNLVLEGIYTIYQRSKEW